MDDITFSKYVVTCETANCWNYNVAIEIDAPAENPTFICGVCTVHITNIVPASNY